MLNMAALSDQALITIIHTRSTSELACRNRAAAALELEAREEEACAEAEVLMAQARFCPWG